MPYHNETTPLVEVQIAEFFGAKNLGRVGLSVAELDQVLMELA